MKRIALGGSALTGALYSSFLPIAALLLLAPQDYGIFSIPYLIYAFGLSLQLSIVTEASTRRALATGLEPAWARFYGTLVALSAVIAVAVAIVCLFVPLLDAHWWLAALAVFAGLLRTGVRYHSLSLPGGRLVIAADLTGVLLFALVLAVSWGRLDPLTCVLAAWLASSVAALAWTGRRLADVRLSVRSWLSDHASTVKPLLTDSLLLDAGSIGTPLLLAPLLGPAQFGVYRGISNVALPVRLALDPLRPAIARQDARDQLSVRTFALILLAGVAMGAACWATLEYVVPALPFQLGTLESLTVFALAAGLFVAASFVGHFYYIADRARATHRSLLTGRIVQTIGAIVLPCIGFVALGLDGAVWGYVLATALSAVVWLAVARTAPDRRS